MRRGRRKSASIGHVIAEFLGKFQASGRAGFVETFGEIHPFEKPVLIIRHVFGGDGHVRVAGKNFLKPFLAALSVDIACGSLRR